MDELIKIAMSQLGQKEISGTQDNQTIVNYAKEAGFDWVNDDETPWCSIFVSWCAYKTDLVRSRQANARSWLLVGTSTNTPEPGDIVVFWRGSIEAWKGHVGIFLGYSKSTTRVYCLGGNQGNQVSISAYPSETVLGFRRLRDSKMVKLPAATLAPADRGDAVKALQDALKAADFDCGTSDGDYGNKTKNAVQALQSTNNALKIDGIMAKKLRSIYSVF